MLDKITESLVANTSEAELHTTAVEILRTAQLDVAKARPEFVAALEQDRSLLVVLANYYLARIAADMQYRQHAAAEARLVEAATTAGDLERCGNLEKWKRDPAIKARYPNDTSAQEAKIMRALVATGDKGLMRTQLWRLVKKPWKMERAFQRDSSKLTSC